MHGLKRSGMSRLALAGVTAPELLATSGHKSLAQAQRYIEDVLNRPELADRAMEKLRTDRNDDYTNAPTPLHKQA